MLRHESTVFPSQQAENKSYLSISSNSVSAFLIGPRWAEKAKILAGNNDPDLKLFSDSDSNVSKPEVNFQVCLGFFPPGE